MALKEASVSRDKLNYRNPEEPSLPAQYTTIASFVTEGFRQAGIVVALGTELDEHRELPVLISSDDQGDFLSAIVDTDFESDRVTHPSNANRPENLEEYLIDFARNYAEAMIAKRKALKEIDLIR